MLLNKVYIRHKENYPDDINTFNAYQGFYNLGVETVPFYGFGDIVDLKDLGPEVGIVGFIGDVWEALRLLNKPIPKPLDYPEELMPWLGRSIRKSTIGEIRQSKSKCFIKPVAHKLFTGFVWEASVGDRLSIATQESDTEVWVSDVVSFVSEYRCFIQDGEIVGVRLYKGDWSKALNKDTVITAVKAYSKQPRGFSLDFGVTTEGQTLLVEVNDGFALGCYGLYCITYARLIEARWQELIGCSDNLP